MNRVFISWFSFLVKSGLFLIIAPLLAAHYNDDQLLFWYFCATIYGFIFTLDIGFSPTISRYIAYGLTHAPSNGSSIKIPNLETSEVLGAARKIYNYLTFLIIITCSVIGFAFHQKISFSGGNSQALWIFFTLASAAQVKTIQSTSILNGYDKVSLQQSSSFITSTYQLLAVFIAISFQLSFEYVFLLFHTGTIFQSLFQQYLCRTILKEKNPSPPSLFCYREILQSSWKSGVGMLMSIGVFQLSGLYYAAYFDKKTAASYMFTLQIARALGSISQVPLYAYLPTLAKYYAASEHQKILTFFSKKLRLTSALYIAGAISFLLIGQPLLTFLGANKISPSNAVITLIFTALFVERLGSAYMQLYTLSNHIIWHWVNGITGTIIIALTFISTPYLQETAFPAAYLAGNLLIISWIPMMKAKSHFNIRDRQGETWLVMGILAIIVFAIIKQSVQSQNAI